MHTIDGISSKQIIQPGYWHWPLRYGTPSVFMVVSTVIHTLTAFCLSVGFEPTPRLRELNPYAHHHTSILGRRSARLTVVPSCIRSARPNEIADYLALSSCVLTCLMQRGSNDAMHAGVEPVPIRTVEQSTFINESLSSLLRPMLIRPLSLACDYHRCVCLFHHQLTSWTGFEPACMTPTTTPNRHASMNRLD